MARAYFNMDGEDLENNEPVYILQLVWFLIFSVLINEIF